MVTQDNLDAVLDTIQNNPAMFAFFFALTVCALAVSLVALREIALVIVVFLGAVVVFSFVVWSDARAADIEDSSIELRACVDGYDRTLNREQLQECVSKYEATRIDENANRLNIAYFLNATTEFSALTIVTLLLLLLGGYDFIVSMTRNILIMAAAVALPLAAVRVAVAEASIIPLMVTEEIVLESIGPIQELLLNLSTEFLGAIVTILVLEGLQRE